VLPEKVLEVDVFKGPFAHIRDVMSRQGSLSIERMCELAQVSRADFYRSLQADQPREEEMAVRTAIQGIAVAHRRRYGYRRITAELRRRGMLVNHKRVLCSTVAMRKARQNLCSKDQSRLHLIVQARFTPIPPN
jgi:hypothetical protein